MSKISSKTYARLQESLYEFPGFSIQLRNVRGYPYPNAAHVLGYLSEVNQAQIEASGDQYTIGDYIGATGLELAYEKELRGKKGVRYLLKDNLGREVGSYKNGDFDSVAVSGAESHYFAGHRLAALRRIADAKQNGQHRSPSSLLPGKY